MPQIRIIKNEKNRGVSFSRNRLISEAVGRYIWFVDPDDIITKCTNKLIEIADNENADIVTSGHVDFTDDGRSYAEYYDALVPRVLQNSFSVTNGIHSGMVTCGIFRRSFVVNNGLTFDVTLHIREDNLFCFECEIRNPKTVQSELICYLYRHRNSSAMYSHSAERNLKKYLSDYRLLKVYLQYEKEGKTVHYCGDMSAKIVQKKEDVVFSLMQLADSKYVKQELKKLKKDGIYPYKPRKTIWGSPIPLPLKFILRLLPIKIFFWLTHYAYKIFFKLKYGNKPQK